MECGENLAQRCYTTQQNTTRHQVLFSCRHPASQFIFGKIKCAMALNEAERDGQVFQHRVCAIAHSGHGTPGTSRRHRHILQYLQGVVLAESNKQPSAGQLPVGVCNAWQ